MTKSPDTITVAALRTWAYKKSEQKLPPQLQDMQTVVKHADLLLTFASDPKCPQRANVLNCLYSLVGNSVSKHDSPDMNLLNELLTKAGTHQDKIILNWVARSRVILRDLRKYDYVEWCGGGFVRKDLAELT